MLSLSLFSIKYSFFFALSFSFMSESRGRKTNRAQADTLLCSNDTQPPSGNILDLKAAFSSIESVKTVVFFRIRQSESSLRLEKRGSAELALGPCSSERCAPSVRSRFSTAPPRCANDHSSATTSDCRASMIEVVFWRQLPSSLFRTTTVAFAVASNEQSLLLLLFRFLALQAAEEKEVFPQQ